MDLLESHEPPSTRPADPLFHQSASVKPPEASCPSWCVSVGWGAGSLGYAVCVPIRNVPTRNAERRLDIFGLLAVIAVVELILIVTFAR